MTANEVTQKVKNNIDTKLVVTGVATAFALGLTIFALGKMGKMGKQLAEIAKGGK